MNRKSLAGRDVEETEPPTDLAISCTASSPTPRPEMSVTSFAVEKPGRNRKSNSSASENFAAISGGANPLVITGCAQCFDVDAAAVVGHGQHEDSCTMSGFQTDGAGWRLAGGHAFVGILDSMIQAVANRMVDRGLKPIEDLPVHFGLSTEDLQLGLFAKLARNVANHPRKSAHTVSKRTHPAGDNLTIEPVREAFRAESEPIQLGLPFRRPQPCFLQLALRRVQRGRCFGRVADRRRCNDSSRAWISVCLRFKSSIDSEKGSNQRLCTSDSPANPIRRLSVSADTAIERSPAFPEDVGAQDLSPIAWQRSNWPRLVRSQRRGAQAVPVRPAVLQPRARSCDGFGRRCSRQARGCCGATILPARTWANCVNRRSTSV